MDRKRIRLLAASIAGLVVLGAVGTHLLLPRFLANRVEERLEERGGKADVTLEAVPAVRLLAGHGDRIEIKGSGLEHEFDDSDEDAFERLDNFDAVEIELTDTEAGPFDTQLFRLTKEGGDGNRYAIEIEATARAQDLAEAVGERFGSLGELIGSIGGGAIPFSAVPLPIRVDGVVESKDGRVAMVEGTGQVAGIPAGPLTQLITNAVLSRI